MYGHLLRLIVFLRGINLMSYIYEWEEFRLIFKVLSSLVKPVSNLLCVLLVFFYCYSLIGMAYFGGLIRSVDSKKYKDAGIDPLHLANNFNDFFSSLVTLFTVMNGNLKSCYDIFNVATNN